MADHRRPGTYARKLYTRMLIMKNFFRFSVKAVVVLFISLMLFGACNKNKPAADALDKDTSYAFGMYMANTMAGQMGMELRFDYAAFSEGFKSYYEGTETRLTPEQAMEKINAAFVAMQSKADERMQAEGVTNQAESEAFLAENSMKSGVVTTPSGLQYEVVTEGSGEKPGAYDNVKVHYEGKLINGTVFDSSYERGEPIEFNLSGVIPGWTEGVQLMSVGSTYNFVIPSDLAYGPGGSGPIPPNAALIFKVELLDIVR